MGKYVENNLNRNETIIRKAVLHPGELIKAWVFGILFCWFFLIPLINAIKVTITYCNTELAITNKRVIGKAGFANSAAIDAPLSKVQNVNTSSGLWGKIFGYGNVVIMTAADKIPFSGIRKPEEFKRALMAQIDQAEEDRIAEQAKAMAAAMAAANNQNA